MEKFVERFLAIVVVLVKILFLPLFFLQWFKFTRENIVRECYATKEYPEESIQAYLRLLKVSAGAVLIGWVTWLYFTWPYLTGFALWFYQEGAIQIWLWVIGWEPYFRFSNLTWGWASGFLMTFAMFRVIELRKKWQVLVKERDDYKRSRDSSIHTSNETSSRYHNVLGGLEAIVLRAKESRNTVKSKAAEALRKEIEMVLATYPGDVKSQRTQDRIEWWQYALEQRFSKDKEAKPV